MNYYIIGSKYGNQANGFKDILPKMLKDSVVATGFNFGDDMYSYVGNEHERIVRLVCHLLHRLFD